MTTDIRQRAEALAREIQNLWFDNQVPLIEEALRKERGMIAGEPVQGPFVPDDLPYGGKRQ